MLVPSYVKLYKLQNRNPFEFYSGDAYKNVWYAHVSDRQSGNIYTHYI